MLHDPSRAPRLRTPAAVATLMGVLCLGVAPESSAQPAGPSTRIDVSGNVNVTNKGISFVPTFTLGRPAVIADVVIRKDTLSFEPQFRYGLDGKPWSMLFWGRYRAIARNRFRLTVGGHPSLSFRQTSILTGTGQRDVMTANRYLAGEIAPTYTLSPHVGLGGYYLYSHAFDPGVPRHNQYVAARLPLTNVPIAGAYAVQALPQIYYLRLDGNDGTYFSASVTLTRRNSSISIASLVNAPIRTNVPGGHDFLWNASVNYALR